MSLPPKDVETLVILVEAQGRIVEKRELMEKIWPDTFVEEANLSRHIFNLRRVLASGDASKSYIETVPKRGYRFVLPLWETPPPESPRNDSQSVTDESVTIPAKTSNESDHGLHLSRRRLTWILVVGSVAAVLTGIFYVLRAPHTSISASMPKVRLAVLPVQNLTGDQSEDVFADGLTEELISQLGKLNPQEVGVIARTSSMAYKNSPKTIDQIGAELDVDYVLETSLRGTRDQFRFMAQLIRAKDQVHLWAQNYDRSSNNLIALEDELGRDITGKIGIHLTPAALARRNRNFSITPNSQLSYLRGRYFWNQRTKEGLERGLQYFQQAIREDSKNAQAYSGIADSYNLMIFYGYSPGSGSILKAKDAAQLALELDPSLAEAHASLAYVDFMWTWEWTTAESEFRRALELDNNYVLAHHWYALYLASMGRHPEADAEMRAAINLDPFSSSVQAAAAYIHFFAGNYDLTIRESQTVLQHDPNFPVAHSVLGLGYEAKGLYPEAIAEFQKVDALTGRQGAFYKGQLGHAYGMTGNRRAAEKVLADLDSMATHGRYVNQTAKAVIYASLGEKDDALQALELARDQNDAGLIWLVVDPRFDFLRAEPRFRDLIRDQGRQP